MQNREWLCFISLICSDIHTIIRRIYESVSVGENNTSIAMLFMLK